MKAQGNSKERTAITMLVLAALLVTLLLLVQSKTVCVRTVRQAQESVLKQDLQEMRKAIDEYTLKNERPPQSLNDLVDGSFLRAIPADPITLKADWVTKFDDLELAAKQRVNGIVDVRSNSGGSNATASRTTAASPYIRDWRQIPAMLSYGGQRTKREASRQVLEFRHKPQVQVHISCFLDR
jgi:general secretion pathway protein G